MSISGSGTGNPGGINEFNLLSDQNAVTTYQRAALGLVRNLDFIIFTDVDKKTLWKYDTSSSKPTLHPLVNMRVDNTPSRIDDSWKDILQQLIDDLPEDVKLAYQQNLLLPPEERNAALVKLGVILEGTAKVLNWINNSAQVLDPNNPLSGPGSEIEARRELNATLGSFVLNGLIDESGTYYTTLKNELQNIGTNHPEYNQLLGFVNQIGMAYSALATLNHEGE